MNKQITPVMLRRIKLFWIWFFQNETQIQEAFFTNVKHDKVFKQLDYKLGYVSKRIGYIVSGKNSQSGKIKIIITAHGYSKLFPKVKALISHAPLSENWEFKALIQSNTNLAAFKQGIDDPYIFQDFELKTSELYFTPLEFNTYRKKMKIMVYMKNYKYHFDNNMIDEAVYIIIQDLVGEENYKKSIDLVQLAQLPENPKNLIHLYELQEYIDFLNKINRRIKIEI